MISFFTKEFRLMELFKVATAPPKITMDPSWGTIRRKTEQAIANFKAMSMNDQAEDSYRLM